MTGAFQAQRPRLVDRSGLRLNLIFGDLRMKRILLALALALAVGIAGAAAPTDAQAAKCLNCGGDFDDNYGESEILPNLPLCTDVCGPTSAAWKTCYVYKTPYAATTTSCGAFGASSSSAGGSGSAGDATTPSCSIFNSPSVKSFSKSASAGQTFGSSLLGASYSLQGSITGKDAATAGTQGDIVELAGSANATANLFYLTKTLVNLTGTSRSEYAKSTSGNLSAYVLGLANWSQSWNVPLTVTKVFSKTFFEKSYPVQVGIFTVTLKGKVSGEARITASGGPTTTGLAGQFTPSMKAYTTASASVSAFGVGVGVEGSVTLLEVASPLKVAAQFASSVVSWGIDFAVVLKSMAGKLKVVVKVPLAPDPSWTIFSWTGWTKTWNLLHASGCNQLAAPLTYYYFFTL